LRPLHPPSSGMDKAGRSRHRDGRHHPLDLHLSRCSAPTPAAHGPDGRGAGVPGIPFIPLADQKRGCVSPAHHRRMAGETPAPLAVLRGTLLHFVTTIEKQMALIIHDGEKNLFDTAVSLTSDLLLQPAAASPDPPQSLLLH